jgi:hypothetical protein
MYGSFTQWMSHIQSEHAPLVWECPSPIHPRLIFDQKELYIDHMREDHPGIFNESQLSDLARITARAKDRLFQSCPFCDDIPKELQGVNPEEQADAEQTAWQNHIIQHLQSVALLSLGWLEDAESHLENYRESDDSLGTASTSALATMETDLPSGDEMPIANDNYFDDVSNETGWHFLPQLPADNMNDDTILRDFIVRFNTQHVAHDRIDRSLYDQLVDSMDVDELNGGRRYISLDVMNQLITKESIEAELRKGPRALFGSRGRLADRVVRKKSTSLFTVLLLIGRADSIEDLLKQGFTDEDLPLTNKKRFTVPKDWNELTCDDLLTKQWIVLPVPELGNNGVHYLVHEQAPLPFSNLEVIIKRERSVDYNAEVNPTFLTGYDTIDTWNSQLELGQTKTGESIKPKIRIVLWVFEDKRDYTLQRGNLHELRRHKMEKYIVLDLGTFEQGNETKKYYIIFPFAKGGDLVNFWKSGDYQSRTPELALWVLQQVQGLAEALQAIHDKFGDVWNIFHGFELKPKNVVHFLIKERRQGILKLQHFRRSRCCRDDPDDPDFEDDLFNGTRDFSRYEAPEVNGRKYEKRASYDLWSLGCIYLEFIIWLVQDWNSLEMFAAAGTSGNRKTPIPFYEFIDGKANVHSAAIEKIAALEILPQSKPGTAIGDLLQLIKTKLLVVDAQVRSELCSELKDIVRKAEFDPEYLGFGDGHLESAS